MIERFNLRVYGILVRKGKLLLSEEQYLGKTLVKFPGGGVEYGEGVQEALVREWNEEAGCPIKINSIFHATDKFIQSAFDPKDQLVSLYYIISSDEDVNDSLAEHKFFWVDLNHKNATTLTFPQDSEVFRLVCDTYGH
ncbi:NUDIX domain-containing protein [Membranicola marinus]|uniref:NUDIX domain-containing protein n=1 Tax=Membranihabitans marinus TaxID=1227546 RepID=A0A953LA76_9BACT|nr:NUDIX domain-containing protein [Membranihabitans marinus]MBY5958408.1 NUDIX domain-containing protein [Membranihabitans marinus]